MRSQFSFIKRLIFYTELNGSRNVEALQGLFTGCDLLYLFLSCALARHSRLFHDPKSGICFLRNSLAKGEDVCKILCFPSIYLS